MKVVSTYSVRLTMPNVPLKDTLHIYSNAVQYLVDVADKEWNAFMECKNAKDAVRVMETMVVKTSNNVAPKYDFSDKFYKFPCYLRRAAIAEAYGMVKSQRSNLANWEELPTDKRGDKPKLPTEVHTFPCLYKNNCFVRTSDRTAKIKVFIRNTWDWLEVKLRKCDVDYISRHCAQSKECNPTLHLEGKVVSLNFPFEKYVTLNDNDIEQTRIVSVDLGLINSCTCSVMEADGTVVGRKFLKLSSEYDSLDKALQRVKNAQRSGAKRKPRLNAKVRGITKNISEKTALFIMEVAKLYDANVVVMEHLDINKKKKGSKKQRLHHWRARYVETLVEHKCHSIGMRFARVCASNTSRLAFDGSGCVLRGKDSSKTDGNYSLCEFSTGKVYNCDLNASYNIGARYYIREILRSKSERTRLALEAKVPSLSHRSTCTMSDLYDLRAALGLACHPNSERIMSGKTMESDAPKGQPSNEMCCKALGSAPL